MANTQCRYFSGYKPCTRNSSCTDSCVYQSPVEKSILIVHLGALGAVVRSTALLKSIQKKYPRAMITWVTDAPANYLLKNHPAIDRVYTSKESDLLELRALAFDVCLVVDKSLKAVGISKLPQVKEYFGFSAHPITGGIVPASEAAFELWELGLDNHKKFFVNTKPETQLICEALELPYQRDDYWLPLSEEESQSAELRRQSWLEGRRKDFIIGLNTGCSATIPYKKLSIEYHRDLISALYKYFPFAQIVLLGGPEDTARNREIAEGLSVIASNTEGGLRDGLISVAAVDVVITGDSLGMHMAISQKKHVLAWFGPTCAQEIDLFERGEKLLSQALCSPCWKRTCEKSRMCYDQVQLEEFINGIKSYCSDRFFGGSPSIDPTYEEVS